MGKTIRNAITNSSSSIQRASVMLVTTMHLSSSSATTTTIVSATLQCNPSLLFPKHHHKNSLFSLPRNPNRFRLSLSSSSKPSPFSSNASSKSSSTHEEGEEHEGSEKFWKREEERWKREEQRWLREESRWLREEARWINERNILLSQIASLHQKLLQKGDNTNSSSIGKSPKLLDSESFAIPLEIRSVGKPYTNNNMNENIKDNVSVLGMQTLEGYNQEGSSIESILSTKFVVPSPESEVSAPKNIPEGTSKGASGDKRKEKSKGTKTRRALRFGFEGDDVKEMQEALANLGFYSGEDEMEFFSFSDGTESAVKTWQASIGVKEDGLMTQELLAQLFGEEQEEFVAQEKSSVQPTAQSSKNAVTNGSAKAPTVKQVAEVQQSVKADLHNDNSDRRVYLLGENRWEEPQRLTQKRQVAKPTDTKNCFSCRGVGKMMCTECGGSGDLNIDDQFFDWVENSNCVYCEGTGYIICDVCEGRG